MTEKELIGKIRELRQIKPNKDWVVLTKSQILGKELTYRDWVSTIFFPVWKPALATVTTFGILFGIFAFAQNSLPGDMLYSVKKITESVQTAFVTEEELPRVHLELANKRLEELAKVARENRVKNLASAINEARESVAKASKNLSGNPVVIKDTVDKLEEKVEIISSSLGVDVGEEIGVGALQQSSDRLYVEYLISDLKTRTLAEAQEEILSEMEELAEEGKYSEALILFHTEFDRPAEEPEEETGESEEPEETIEEEETIDFETK